jgi:hypothetical protein
MTKLIFSETVNRLAEKLRYHIDFFLESLHAVVELKTLAWRNPSIVFANQQQDGSLDVSNVPDWRFLEEEFKVIWKKEHQMIPSL